MTRRLKRWCAWGKWSPTARASSPPIISRGWTDFRRRPQIFRETHRDARGGRSGIYYTYRNEPGSTDIISNGLDDVLAKINTEIDARNDPLAAVIRGEDILWDVSLMKFIYEMTSSSVGSNLAEMHSRGLLSMENGVPVEARVNIEDMFRRLKEGSIEPRELQAELERWSLFEAYQDRFLAALRR